MRRVPFVVVVSSVAACLVGIACVAPPAPTPAPPDANASIVETVRKDDPKKSGLQVIRRSGGSVQATVTWKDGVKEGPSFEYDEKGKCITAGQYAAGEKTGLWREWSSCGELTWETSYVAGKKDGVRTQWANDCDPKSPQEVAETMTFKEGVKQGPCVAYWSGDGTVKSRGDYDKGERHGTWNTFYRDGKPMKTIVYEHGERVSEVDHHS